MQIGKNYSKGAATLNNFGKSDYFKATMIAGGGLSGGISSSISGGGFWQGVRQGLITSGLNHAAHAAFDNGYERDSNSRTGYKKINNKGGDVTDYLYENGEIIASTSSIEYKKVWSEWDLSGGGYGVRYNNQGGGMIDPTGAFVYGFISVGLASKFIVGRVLGIFAAKGSIQAIKAGQYTFTNTAAKHLATRPYMNSPGTIKNIMKSGKGVPDQFFKGGMNYKVPGTFNGSKGIYELGINSQTNTIYHYLFRTVK